MRTVLDDVLDTVKPKKRFFTRDRVSSAATVAAQLLSLVVLKRPGLAPLQAALTALLAPSKNSTTAANSLQLVGKIRQVREQLVDANEEDQVRLKAQLDLLLSMLLGDDDGKSE